MDGMLKISDSTKFPDKAEKPASNIIGERDSRSTPKSRRNSSDQIIGELAALSMNQQGRNEIQKIIDSNKISKNEYFFSKCISILEEKGISIPLDHQGTLNRRIKVNEVKEKWGNDLAKVFAYVRGLITKEKSEQLQYKREDIIPKFKQYNTKAKLLNNGRISMDSSLGKKNKCNTSIDLVKGNIDLPSCEREQDSDALQLSSHLGELWLYALSKVKEKKDDYNQTIKMSISEAEKCPLNRLKQNNINNAETKNTFILFLRDDLQKYQIKGSKKGKISGVAGTIVIDRKRNEEFIAIMGTPNGHVASFLPKHYKFGSEERVATKIEVKFSNLPQDKPIDEVDYSDIWIDEITFQFERTHQ